MQLISSLNVHKGKALAVIVAGICMSLVLGCGSDATDDGATVPNTTTMDATEQSTNSREITPVLANSVLITGQNRIAVGFLDSENRVLSDLDITAVFYREGGEAETNADDIVPLLPRMLGSEPHHADMYGATLTVFAGMVNFPDPGRWGVTLNVTGGGRTYDPIRATFEVVADSPQPAPGEQAPATRQTVLSQVSELGKIDTSFEPDPTMHQRTIADALSDGRPMVVAFATPAFCETRFCGPVMEEVIQPLQTMYGDRATFIHIEPYDVERARSGQLVPVPAMAEWRLGSEPWVFVVNGDGSIAARFEGLVTRDDIEPALLATFNRVPTPPSR